MKANKICLYLFFIQGILNNWQVLMAQNLIPNCSFENYTTCPIGPGKIYYSDNWFQPVKGPNFSVNQGSSSEYFNSCNSGAFSMVSVPENYQGYQFARTGNAYIGFGYFEASIVPNQLNNTREYAEVKLLNPLEPGVRYRLEYYVSLANNWRFAIKQLQAAFTVDSLLDSLAGAILFATVPQIQNTNFISDTTNWVKVSGSFVANGGELFLTLGNFFSDTITDTLELYPYSLNYGNGAYYYIDDVSLTLDSSAGINELISNNNYSVIPNPANESFKVICNEVKNKRDVFFLYTNFGEAVLKKQINEIENIQLTNDLPNGMYYWRCGSSSGKLAIIKDK